MGFTAAGITKETVSTDQLAPLGFQLTVPNGDFGHATYVYVKTAALITAGAICVQSGTATPYLVDESGAAAFSTDIYGVAQVDIASGSYGFVIAKGYAPKVLCTGAASPAPGEQILTAANGIAATNAMNTAPLAMND